MVRRKKILFIDDTAKLGGAQISLLNLMSGLHPSCFYPILLCRNDGALLQRAEAYGIETIPASLAGLRNPAGFISDVFFLFSILKTKKIDLLHINSPFLFKYAALLSIVVSVPAVGHMRDISTLSGVERKFFNRLDYIIAISDSVAKALKESQVKPPVSVIYNGVNLDTFHPSQKRRKEFRRRYNISDDEIIIGICSRIAPEKGHATFVKAASLVAPEKRKIRFIIAGDSVFNRNQDFKCKLKLLARDLGVDSRIVWTGFVEKTEELYPALDILVVASKAEPFGRVAIEAGACGIPVIGTTCGGIPEIVQHDRTGILIPAENPVLLAHAIAELAENRENRMKLGRQAVNSVAANFSLTNHVAAVEKLYFQLLGLN